MAYAIWPASSETCPRIKKASDCLSFSHPPRLRLRAVHAWSKDQAQRLMLYLRGSLRQGARMHPQVLESQEARHAPLSDGPFHEARLCPSHHRGYGPTVPRDLYETSVNAPAHSPLRTPHRPLQKRPDLRCLLLLACSMRVLTCVSSHFHAVSSPRLEGNYHE